MKPLRAPFTGTRSNKGVKGLEETKALFAWLVAFFGGVATILGGIKAVDAVRKKAAERRDAKEKALATRISDMVTGATKEELAEIRAEIKTVSEQQGTLQSEKINWAYDYFVIKRKPLPIYQKNALEKMYKQYTGDGYAEAHQNGVPHDFLEKLSECEIVG